MRPRHAGRAYRISPESPSLGTRGFSYGRKTPDANRRTAGPSTARRIRSCIVNRSRKETVDVMAGKPVATFALGLIAGLLIPALVVYGYFRFGYAPVATA